MLRTHFHWLTLLIGIGALAAFQNCSKVNLGAVNSVEGASMACLPEDAPGLAPVLKYNWALTYDAGDPTTKFNQVMSAPMVGDLDGDGVPELVFTAFSGLDMNSYGSLGALRVLDGKTGRPKGSVVDPAIAPIGYTSPLLVDLQGDGHKQIVYYNGSAAIALNADLSLRWTLALPAPLPNCMGGFAAADLDGTGHAQIIADQFVLDESPSHVPSVRFTMAGHSNCTSFAASLDPSKPNQMQVVGGDGVYDAQGHRLFAYGSADFQNGYLAAADVDPTHPGREVAITRGGQLGLFDGTTGELIWRSEVDDSLKCVNADGSTTIGNGGPPNIGDFQGNGHLDIGIASGQFYTVWDRDGKLLWKYHTRDCSSAITGATLFDFNGDGKPEIVYADEHYLRIFDAANGSVLFQIPNNSATLMEYPVVADVDGDGHSELIVVGNNIFSALAGFYSDVSPAEEAAIEAVPPGIRVFGAASPTAWVPTGKVWNQYAYFVDNVDQNLRPTSKSPTTAASGADLFRQNVLTEFKAVCK